MPEVTSGFRAPPLHCSLLPLSHKSFLAQRVYSLILTRFLMQFLSAPRGDHCPCTCRRSRWEFFWSALVTPWQHLFQRRKRLFRVLGSASAQPRLPGGQGGLGSAIRDFITLLKTIPMCWFSFRSQGLAKLITVWEKKLYHLRSLT